VWRDNRRRERGWHKIVEKLKASEKAEQKLKKLQK
jgi:hypothetical protein